LWLRVVGVVAQEVLMLITAVAVVLEGLELEQG
jgi:hypothetical protein